MKFTTTENTVYRAGIGNIPKAWIEYTAFDKYKDYGDVYTNSIKKYFYDHIRIYDWDECGNENHDFVFEDGKSFRLEYSWWSEWYHDDDEKNGLKQEYYIEEISIDEANVPEKKIGRDWL